MLSAVEGLEVATAIFEPYVLPITIGILVGLFLFQRSGTEGHDQTHAPVSPHFRPGQFPAKGPDRWPRYLVLQERLLLKLELLVERGRERGLPDDGWQVLSGYRSPRYNRSIGQPVYSRHQYGDAADVYADTDGNGRMDDLDGDGRVDLGDADVLYQIVDRMDAAPNLSRLFGGLGKYVGTSTHGPFLHLDARGHPARW